MINQILNLAQVSQPNENIKETQMRIPNRGTQGTKGVLKGRGNSG